MYIFHTIPSHTCIITFTFLTSPPFSICHISPSLPHLHISHMPTPSLTPLHYLHTSAPPSHSIPLTPLYHPCTTSALSFTPPHLLLLYLCIHTSVPSLTPPSHYMPLKTPYLAINGPLKDGGAKERENEQTRELDN